MNVQLSSLCIALTAVFSMSCQLGRTFNSNADAESVSGAQPLLIGTLLTQERVCVRRFVDGYYIVSAVLNDKCTAEERRVSESQLQISSEAYKPWLQEVPPAGKIQFDIRYATNKIFPRGDGTYRIDHSLYGKPRCFLHPNAAVALSKADQRLRELRPELRLYVFDCYRPRYVSELMWKLIQDPRFVAASGRSLHNKGAAVDLSLARMEGTTPVPLDMGSEFDLFDFEKSRFPGDVSEDQRRNRQLLREVMTHPSVGFSAYDDEWWHFSTSGHHEFLNFPL